MKILELVKTLSLQDIILLSLDEMGFSDRDIASRMGISPTTIHNSKKRLQRALDASETPTKAEYGNPEVNSIVNTFKESFGTTKTTKADRFAANRLAKKHGAESIAQAIKAFSAHAHEKFAPSVNNVAEFDNKLPSIVKFMSNKSSEQEINL